MNKPDMRALLASAQDPTAILRQMERKSFRAFVRAGWPRISGGDEIAWNWHIDAIAYELDRVARGRSLRLLVNVPPRQGKSKIVSVLWVAWMLGQNPAANFVCASYSNELSGKMARDCLSVMQTAWYRELFPRTRISPKRTSVHDFDTTAGGGRLATSVGGTLTGRGGDILIIDDPIKPDEALSETVRAKTNDWFRSTLSTRLDNKAKGAILCVMQRLHQDDPCGMLIEAGGWHQLALPAIATQGAMIPIGRSRVHHRKVGDLLHPEREDLSTLMRQKADMGSAAFEAQYQQEPVPATGNMAKAHWLRRFDLATLARRPGQIVQSWDTASKDGIHNDWSVCITAHVLGNMVSVLDVFRDRLDFVKLNAAAIRLAHEHQADVLLIEDAASGQQLLQMLRAQQPPGVPFPIPRQPEMDKQSRFAAACAMMEAGQVSLPADAMWLGAFEAEILAFPNGKHDDQADALSQLMIWVRQQMTMVDQTPPHGGYIIDVSTMTAEEYYNMDDPGDGDDAILY